MPGLSPAMPPATAALPAMAPRIDLLECLADVFVGGVLCTLSALAMGGPPVWLGLEPGRKLLLPLGLLLRYTQLCRSQYPLNVKRPAVPQRALSRFTAFE